MLTINDTTTTPLNLTSGQTVDVFAGSVTDTSPLGNTETVTVSVNAPLYTNGTETNLGTLQDPNGGGTFVGQTFDESGLDSGTPTFATSLLTRLQYTAPTLANGQSAVILDDVTVTDGNGNTAAIANSAIDVNTAPAITGTVADEPVASGSTIRPFATVGITDNDFGYYYTTSGETNLGQPMDSATITISDGGNPTDADGLLTGAGLSKTGTGTYSLGAVDPYQLEDELAQLRFATSMVAAGLTSSPTFTLTTTDVNAGLTSTDANTSLSIIGPTPVPTPPVIVGNIASQNVMAGNAIDPFSAVTVTDTNVTPSVSATISMNVNGTPSDANGTLTGTGLTETAAGSGTYTLTAASPATLTTELNSLAFHDSATSGSTSFALTVNDAADITPATASTTVVVKGAPPPPPTGTNNFTINDQTTGTSTSSAGTPYTGPVAGLTSQYIIVSSDNLNISSSGPNMFISVDGGTGEDAINTAAGGGNNIINGSDNSSFLTGGSGDNQFFVDDRTPPNNAAIWTTVSDMHAGDVAVVWGLTQNDFAMTENDNAGAVGFTGLTIGATVPGEPVANLTLTGYTTADLSNGKLSISYGQTQDLPGLPGSAYMEITAH